jgi:ketosteroid isomerase-like protein
VAAALLSAVVAWPASAANVAAELRAVEEVRREAIKRQDFDTLSRIYAPGFVAIAGNGDVIDRARLFDAFRRTDPALTFQTDEIHVLEQAGFAVFYGRLTARNRAGAVVFAARFSHTFVRKDGQWLCVYGQSTPLPL